MTKSNSVSNLALADGISRVGDLLRLYMLPFLAFYAIDGTPADRALFSSVTSLVQAVPTLLMGNYAGRFLRRVSPLSASISANIGLGALSLLTALVCVVGFINPTTTLVLAALVGFMEVVYYPARECLYAEFADGDDQARDRANRRSTTILHAGRGGFAIFMMVFCYAMGAVPDEVPLSAIAAAFFFDAVTFAVVVAFLALAPKRDTLISEEETFTGSSFRESAKVPGVLPIVACIFMVYSFAYSGFYFSFCFYKELAGVTEYERQLSFYAVQFACAVGGVLGARFWVMSYPGLFSGISGICLVNATLAIAPTNWVSGTGWLMANWCIAIFVHAALFEGIIPQLVQGLKRNAEVAALITLVKEGISPFVIVGVTALASWLDAPRQVLFIVGITSLALCVITLLVYRTSIKDVLSGTSSVKKV